MKMPPFGEFDVRLVAEDGKTTYRPSALTPPV
jgi:hypothetical protein